MTVFKVFVDPAIKLTLYFVAVVWVCAVLGCAVWVGYSFLHENFGAIFWPVKVS